MNANFIRPEIGQWYARADKDELFQVVRPDAASRTIEVQSFDGDLDEMDNETWATLPLERVETPEDWTAPRTMWKWTISVTPQTDMAPADWAKALQSLKVQGESWDETEPEEEQDPLGEGVPAELFAGDVPQGEERAGRHERTRAAARRRADRGGRAERLSAQRRADSTRWPRGDCPPQSLNLGIRAAAPARLRHARLASAQPPLLSGAGRAMACALHRRHTGRGIFVPAETAA